MIRKTMVFVIVLCFSLFLLLPLHQASASFVFKEDFNKNTINPSLWEFFTVGSGTSVSTYNQRLEIDVNATSANDPDARTFGAGISSHCKLSGDFDIQVNFSLLNWPEMNGVRIGLITGEGGFNTTVATMERLSFGLEYIRGFGQEAYLIQAINYIPGGGGRDSNDQLGTLRLTRSNNVVTGYFMGPTDWVSLAPILAATDDVKVSLGAWSHDNTFRDQNVKISFDDFIVNSGTLVGCSTVTPTPTVVVFKQNDPLWGNKEYASANEHRLGCGTTIAQCGCALTSIAMVLNHHGATKDPTTGNPTTPETVNEYFKLGPTPVKCRSENGNWYPGIASQGYYCGAVKWSTPDQYSAAAFKKYATQKILWLTNKFDQLWNVDTVKQDVTDNKPVILKVSNNPHWALATGAVDNTFTINDPALNRDRLDQSPYNNSAFAIRRYIKTSSDFSRFEVASFAPNQILVTDPDGKRIGNGYEEIPNAIFFFDKMITDDTDPNSSLPDDYGISWVVISTPKQGDYGVEIISPPGEEPNFVVYSSDRDANLTFQPFEASSSELETTRDYQFVFAPEPGQQTLKLKTLIDIRPYILKNWINCKSNEIIPVALLGSKTFNVSDVVQSSVTFAGASDIFNNKKIIPPFFRQHDINHDSYPDLIFFFYRKNTNLTCSSTLATLTGKLKQGMIFEGNDTIKMVKFGVFGKEDEKEFFKVK